MDISLFRYDLFFIRETAKQIIKDFDFFGIEIQFSGQAETAYDELKNQLIPLIAKLLKNDYAKIISLLYRIDVMERKMERALLPEYGAFRPELISDLIIERELQKVITRKIHKDNQV
jgi:hypothetical protein